MPGVNRGNRREGEQRSIQWVLTLNNYLEEEERSLRQFAGNDCRYAIIGKETGASGTPHLQCYFRLEARCTFSAFKSKVPERSHVEAARGGAKRNFEYCSKDKDYEEYGERPFKGVGKNRDDIAREFVQKAEGQGGSGVREFADDNPGVWYFSGHNLRRNYCGSRLPITRADIHVEWVYGAPGVGKSKYAHEQLPTAYIKDPRTKWWNGYMLEPDCIIDDFAPGGIDINHLLRWFDRYKCLVEVKGEMCPLYVQRFIVTSNFSPQECFTDTFSVPHVQLPALMRRISVTHMM